MENDKEKAGAIIQASLLEAIEEVNSDLGGVYAHLSSDGMLSDLTTFISTGSALLDMVLRGGVPLGRIVEIYGVEDVGKTTLAVHLMINCQRMGGVCVFLDSESAFFKQRAVEMGLDLRKLIELDADSLEEGFQHIFKVLEKFRSKPELSDTPILFVWDTIASAPAVAEIPRATSKKNGKEEEVEGMGMIHRPKIIRKAMRAISRLLTKKKTTLVLLNQMVGGPKGEDSPGGFGIKHHASQRILLKKVEQVSDSRGIVGIGTEARVVKNKVDGPWAITNKVKLQISALGFDDINSIVDLLVKSKDKEVYQSGAWYKFKYNGEEFSSYGQNIPKIVAEKQMEAWLRDKAARCLLTSGPRGYERWAAIKQQEVKS